MTQRDGTGREVGRGFRMGTRVHPWWIHVDVWQNQYNIVKLKKIFIFTKVKMSSNEMIS